MTELTRETPVSGLSVRRDRLGAAGDQMNSFAIKTGPGGPSAASWGCLPDDPPRLRLRGAGVACAQRESGRVNSTSSAGVPVRDRGSLGPTRPVCGPGISELAQSGGA
jgi:hypothetical protein